MKSRISWMPISRVSGAFISVVVAGIVLYSVVSANTASGPVQAATGGVSLPRDGGAFERLSDYNLFKDFAAQTPNTGVVPYDMATPLFTDYASKHRFVYVPEGQAAQYDPEEMFDYPVGTILVKTFGYLNDIRDAGLGEELIETRLLIRGRRGWSAWTYVYDEGTEDAVLTVNGACRRMTWTHYDGNERSIDYIVPTVKDCRSCHNDRYDVVPIGPKAWNLNRDFAYDHGTENQLAHWVDIGFLEGAPKPEAAPSLPVWNDESSGALDARARAYLEVNCAHCHNPNGPADKTTLDLRWTQDNPFNLGIGRRPNEGIFERDRDGRDNGVRGWFESLFEDDDRDRDRRRRGDGDRDPGDQRRGDGGRDRDRREREEGESGWDRPWVPDDFDWGGREFDIVPGKPDESILVYRMDSLDPGIAMPRVPHLQVHEEGVALIREWILAMDDADLESQ